MTLFLMFRAYYRAITNNRRNEMTKTINFIHENKALTGKVVEENDKSYVVIIVSYEAKKHKKLIGKKFLVRK
jgi:ribosomal protein L21E